MDQKNKNSKDFTVAFEGKNLRLVGRVKDAQGLKGELFVSLIAGQADWLDDLREFFLRTPTGIKKFSVTRSRPHKNGVVLLCAELSDRTQAEALRGFDFLIPEELLVSAPGERIYLGEIIGFQVEHADGRFIGKVQSFRGNGAQDLMVVVDQQAEWEIPLVDAFILEINFAEKKIVMNLPPGLVEDI